ncbi:negative cofactor 2 complex subunit alpha [Trichinella spiralis]|uniref:negative cofactor 2 complex subunit alpha n=1 Tax=Trichinella spiralis TaxID=6334 RepID=UPI0001EFCBE2|nr:negative cofactor 2 complex subunit alpha [Trichinella spiralis]
MADSKIMCHTRRRARIPPVKVKRVLQSNEEVGKMSNAIPILFCTFAQLLEHFIEQLLIKADEVANGLSVKTLTPVHMEPTFSFLNPLLAEFGDYSKDRRAISLLEPHSSGSLLVQQPSIKRFKRSKSVDCISDDGNEDDDDDDDDKHPAELNN